MIRGHVRLAGPNMSVGLFVFRTEGEQATSKTRQKLKAADQLWRKLGNGRSMPRRHEKSYIRILLEGKKARKRLNRKHYETRRSLPPRGTLGAFDDARAPRVLKTCCVKSRRGKIFSLNFFSAENGTRLSKEQARFRSKGKRVLWMSRHILHGCPCARRALPSCIPGNTMSLWLDEVPAAAPRVGARQRGQRDLSLLAWEARPSAASRAHRGASAPGAAMQSYRLAFDSRPCREAAAQSSDCAHSCAILPPSQILTSVYDFTDSAGSETN